VPIAVAINDIEEELMALVMIGIDPHKRSHTASAIAPNEEDLAELTVPASGR
jgi:hypothetical protein